MTDLRRSILWGVFLVSLFLIYDAWNRHNGRGSMLAPTVARQAAPASPASSAFPGGLPVPGDATVVKALAAADAASAAVRSELVTVNTDVLKVTIDSKGGDFVRAELLKEDELINLGFFDTIGKLFTGSPTRDITATGRNVVLFDRSPERLYVAQSGLIPSSGTTALPNHNTMMTVAPGPRDLKPGADQVQLRLESPTVGGLKVVKTYTFKRNDYVVGVKVDVVNESSIPVDPRLYMRLVRDGVPPPGGSAVYSTFTGPAIYDETQHYTRIDFSDIEKGEASHATKSDNGWIAMVQHYYASAWLVDPAGDAKLLREYFTAPVDMNDFFPTGVLVPLGLKAYSVGMFVPLGSIAPQASRSFESRLFVGPQEEEKLNALAPGLDLVKDYGIFAILSRPLFWLLAQLHKIFNNWGWAIVGLVVLLKIAFYWLNASAYRSMAKMKAVGPRIQEMRERLKDKPQQMQQEMMRIYREEKINPLGGCLPILVQMPFFIALYWVLLSSVEMRHAPWIGWISDLSAKDPYFILPLLMTVTSFVQAWLQPAPPDPVQARMMLIMPLVFSVMFFVFPAGLVLYWLTNNLLTIAQQALINRQLGVSNVGPLAQTPSMGKDGGKNINK